MTDPILDLLPTLQEGDHLKVNGIDTLYSRHSTEHGCWLEVVTHEGYLMLALPGDSDATWSPEVKLESLELVTRPEFRYPCHPERGDWFYIWYYPDSPPALYVFWDIYGPFKDGSYTIAELHPHDIPKWRKRECKFDTIRGWTNGVEMKEDGLYDCGRRIPFFTPPFVPDCLRLPPSQLRLLR